MENLEKKKKVVNAKYHILLNSLDPCARVCEAEMTETIFEKDLFVVYFDYLYLG